MLVGLSFLSPTNCFDALGDEGGGPTEASPLKPESPDAEINEYLPKYELNYAEGSYSPPDQLPPVGGCCASPWFWRSDPAAEEYTPAEGLKRAPAVTGKL